MPKKTGNPINDEITATELRVIDAEGGQAGVMLTEKALELAENSKLDLVLISPGANPPVAKIMDYGKYRYEQQKREKEAKKKQKVIEIKEVRLTPAIEDHDLTVKSAAAIKFLKEGNKVKVSLRFRGRERGRVELGVKVMEHFADVVSEYGKPDKKAALEGRSLTMMLNPTLDKEKK
ncbi:MAG: translation initiation factor IF-3 [Clostridiales Family XIII bacterium]|jgi:translation initiation factor IF-3|nr:translation initiation factor IF-3 [Clostridiales Family XIII bacterium]